VSESLLVNVKWTICKLHRGENKLHFHQLMMMSILY